jgi:hypothetical protein
VSASPALKQNFGDAAELVNAPALPYAAMTIAPPELMARLLLRVVSAPGRTVPEHDIRGYAAQRPTMIWAAATPSSPPRKPSSMPIRAAWARAIAR